jgi:hypothetical protein
VNPVGEQLGQDSDSQVHLLLCNHCCTWNCPCAQKSPDELYAKSAIFHEQYQEYCIDEIILSESLTRWQCIQADQLGICKENRQHNFLSLNCLFCSCNDFISACCKYMIGLI